MQFHSLDPDPLLLLRKRILNISFPFKRADQIGPPAVSSDLPVFLLSGKILVTKSESRAKRLFCPFLLPDKMLVT